MYKKYFKRFFDLLSSLIGLLVLSPILFIVTIMLCFVNQFKPFFYQKRPGKNGKIFSIIKFKTMNDKKDTQGNFLSDAERLTSIGTFIRNTSFDEIPQLFNVIKGDLSIIGPRPLRTFYLPLYSEEQKKRHDVRPGITGWAQVNGRNAISWEQKFKYDIWYVENMSFLLDFKIVFLTIKKIFMREGISQEGQVTIERFNGKN